uniref:EF-hand domain-containing protein n=1 Tax=Tetradesmus obliquus TaxID=3088 RepID=A0A383VCZ7_TETOB|eukprot:jgi/Sobl393_1/6794/SZX62246.1
MGSCQSRATNPIDAALLQALIQAKKDRHLKGLTFNELLLKFPKMAAGFRKVRKYFDMLDLNGDRVIDMREFTSQAHKLGLDMSLQDLTNVFDAADIDHSTKIDVFEFVLVFVVVHLLSPERAAALPPEIRTTLEIVEDAFCCFDASADGYLEKEEVQTALCTTNTPGRTTKALSDKLFAQLDFDGSGGISFKEFLIGLEKMVMEEFDDEDGEEDEEAAAARRDEEARLLAATRMKRQQQQARQQQQQSRSGSGSGGHGQKHSSSGGGHARAR